VKGRFHFIYWDIRGPKVVRYVGVFPNETELRGPTNTTFLDPNNAGFVLDLAVGSDGTLHAVRSLPAGWSPNNSIQHSVLLNVPPTCLVSNLLDGETVRDVIKVLVEADPLDDVSAIELIQVRIGDDGEWADVSMDVVGTYLWDTNSVEDGSVNLSFRAWDGFRWGGSTIGIMVQNNDPPHLTATSPVNGDRYQDSIEVSGRGVDTRGFDEGWTLERSWDGINWTPVPQAKLVDEWTIEYSSIINTSGMARGAWTLHLRLSDGVLYSDTVRIPFDLNWLPDLVVGSEGIGINPPDVVEGEVCTVEVTIRNQGRGSSVATKLSLDTSDGPVATPLAVPSLDPGGETIISFPWKAEKGTVTFTTIIDTLNDLEEEDDGNNAAIVEFKIPPKKDANAGIPGDSAGLVLVAMAVCSLLIIRSRKVARGTGGLET
jgi:hypothetical protein